MYKLNKQLTRNYPEHTRITITIYTEHTKNNNINFQLANTCHTSVCVALSSVPKRYNGNQPNLT